MSWLDWLSTAFRLNWLTPGYETMSSDSPITSATDILSRDWSRADIYSEELMLELALSAVFLKVNFTPFLGVVFFGDLVALTWPTLVDCCFVPACSSVGFSLSLLFRGIGSLKAAVPVVLKESSSCITLASLMPASSCFRFLFLVTLEIDKL